MEKKLKLILEHLSENSSETCDCSICHKQECGTFMDGILTALLLIPKRNK